MHTRSQLTNIYSLLLERERFALLFVFRLGWYMIKVYKNIFSGKLKLLKIYYLYILGFFFFKSTSSFEPPGVPIASPLTPNLHGNTLCLEE